VFSKKPISLIHSQNISSVSMLLVFNTQLIYYNQCHILAMQEADTGGLWFKVNLGNNVIKILPQKISQV
jgi:hypothetical protein